MSDRELLELAAKAAGMSGDIVTMFGGGFNFRQHGDDELWNPLTDDGDALRLAVKLKIDVMHNEDGDRDPWVMAQMIDCVEDVNDESQRPVATRRAIVRAAAEIGRAMK
jgi:hypothetical protein